MSTKTSKIEKLAPPKGVEPKAKTEKSADKTTLKNAEQTISYQRILKWVYPEGCTSAKDRKVFRQKNRGLIRRAEAHALKVTGEEKQALIDKANAVRKSTLTKPEDMV